jgi:hypothetical protein
MIETMLALHRALARGDLLRLAASRALRRLREGAYGWFVHVPDDDHPDLPADLAECIAQARGLGCDWLMFDRDADTLTILPTYDW